MVPFPCPFFPAGGREKTGHRNGFGVYRPHRQRFPVGNRLILVVLGLSGPSRLAAVWWISLLSSHLRLKNLLSAWPPFLIPEIGAAWCRACCRCGPDVSCDEEPPCTCDLISLYRFWSNLQYTYSICTITESENFMICIQKIPACFKNRLGSDFFFDR